MVDVVAPLAREVGQALPGVARTGPVHAPAEQGLHLHRQQRGLMPPVFEQAGLLAPRLGLQQFARIGAQAREGRQVVGAGDHIHRVDLDRPQPLGQLAKLPPANLALRPRVREPLGGQGDAPGLAGGEVVTHPAKLAGVHPVFQMTSGQC